MNIALSSFNALDPLFLGTVVGSGVAIIVASISIFNWSNLNYNYKLQHNDLKNNKKLLEKKLLYPKGLVNPGNLCFMNSVLQALASLSSLQTYLNEKLNLSDSNLVIFDQNDHLYVCDALFRLIFELNSLSSKKISINSKHLVHALHRLSRNNRRLINYDQQDAQELFQIISQQINKEGKFCKESLISILNKNNLDNKKNIFYLGKTFILNSFDEKVIFNKSLKNPFQGLLCYKVMCFSCGYKSTYRLETYDNISLSLEFRMTTKIENVLTNYILPENLVDCYTCQKCSLTETLNFYNKILEKKDSFLNELRLHKKKIYNNIPLQTEANISTTAFIASTTVNSSISNSENTVEKRGSSSLQNKKKKKKNNKKKVKKNNLDGIFNAEDNTNQKSPNPTPQEFDDLIRENLFQLIKCQREVEQIKEALLHAPETDLPKGIKLQKVITPLAKKQCVFANQPKILVLHMQRSIFQPNGYVRKNNTRVEFEEFLDLKKFSTCLKDENFGNSKEDGVRFFGKGGNLWKGGDDFSLKRNDIVKSGKNFECSKVNAIKNKSVDEIREDENTLVDISFTNGSIATVETADCEKNKPPLNNKVGKRTVDTENVTLNFEDDFKENKYLYRLQSVVIHYGGHDSGHFVTYRRCSQKKNKEDKTGGVDPWFRISDESVLPCNFEEVKDIGSQFVYMLFYEKY